MIDNSKCRKLTFHEGVNILLAVVKYTLCLYCLQYWGRWRWLEVATLLQKNIAASVIIEFIAEKYVVFISKYSSQFSFLIWTNVAMQKTIISQSYWISNTDYSISSQLTLYLFLEYKKYHGFLVSFKMYLYF